MKKILIIIALLCTITTMAQTPKQLMSQGNQAFQKGDFAAASEAYNAILEAGYSNASVYYNLGNAYYRQDEFGLAILNYERALRIKPNFRDARENLALAYSKTEDEIAALPQLFIVTWAHNVVAWFSPSGWHIIILCIIALLGGLLAVVLLSTDYRWRKSALIGGIALSVLLIIAIACAISSNVQYRRHNQAIVTSPMVVVKSSPENNSVDKLILHEGTKVHVDESLDQWLKIHIADGNTGWVTTDDITVI